MSIIKISSYLTITFASVVAIALILSMAGFVHAQDNNFGVFNNLNRGNSGEFVQGEVVVKYKNDHAPFHVQKVNRGQSVADAVRTLSQNPNVEYAEPNYIVSAYAVPNDPFYNPYQWNFDNAVNGGVHAEAAWDVSTGAGTVVAVVDTGIAYENYTTGKGRFKQGYTQAPDLSGTCFVQGHDYVNNDTHPNDDESHGTHVAGTIAQRTNNNFGTAGLAYDTCLMPVKVLNNNGSGSHTAIALGIRYAVDNGADVINLSLGGPTGSQTLHDAVLYAYNNGVTVVAATGNDDGAIGYPALYDDAVIAVGATRYDEARAPYSNFGPSIDIVAPGGDTTVDQNGDGVVDGIVQNTFNPNTGNVNDFGYWLFSGTSMATPHVAAAAAMVIANGNATTPDDVRAALESTADDLGDAGFDNIFGNGLLNIEAALAWTAGQTDNNPTVTLTSPIDNSVVSGVVNLTATASDDGAVTKVEFYVDGGLIDTDITAPYESTWNTLGASEGGHTVTATVYDDAATTQTTNDSVSVTVDNINDAPVANAGSNQTVEDTDGNGSELVSLDGSGSSDVDGNIVLYEWSEGSNLIGTGASTSVVLPLGLHTLTLLVTDDGGAVNSDAVDIDIVVPPPTPDITLSLSGSKVKGRHVVTLTWSGATEANVDISRDSAPLTNEPNNTGGTNQYVDTTGNRGGRTYTYQVCEEGSNTMCSAEMSITF